MNRLPFPAGFLRTADWCDLKSDWVCRFGWHTCHPSASGPKTALGVGTPPPHRTTWRGPRPSKPSHPLTNHPYKDTHHDLLSR